VKTYNEFRNSKNNAVLICTDVASRGLDFLDVNNTILLDMPDSLTEYAHRIGRTARIDHPGRSVIVLFEKVKFLKKEVKFLDKLN
jgi:superfamily II DNA/RNA helicase